MKPKLNYIKVPLNFVCTEGSDHGFQVFAGPYVAFCVGDGGSYKVTIQSTDPDAAPFNGNYPSSLKVEYGDTQNDNANVLSGNSLPAPHLVYTARYFAAGLNGGVG